MKKHLTAIFILSIGLLVGCSNNSQDITTTDSKPEHITMDIVNAEGNIVVNIDSDVIYSESNDIAVVTTNRYEFTNDDIIRIADGLYDNSEYSSSLTTGDIRITKDIYFDLIDDENKKIEDLENLYNNNKIDSDYYNQELLNCQYYIVALTECIDSAPEDANLSTTPTFEDITYRYAQFDFDENRELIVSYESYTFEGCCTEGLYNSMPCKLNFWPHIIRLELYDMDKFVWKTYLYDAISIGEMSYDCYVSNNPNIENDCVYSVNDATELCNNLLEQVGISNMAPMDICNIPVTAYNTSPTGYQYGKTIDTGYCGYKIYYGKSINSVNYNLTTLITGGANPSLFEVTDANTLYGDEYIIFTVMDSGIISMEYQAPTSIEDITTDVTILDLDSILSYADTYLAETYSDRSASSAPLNVTKIQFGLARSSNSLDTDTFTLIPVWDFYYDDSFNPIITINAIDGSKIDRYSGLTVE